MNKTDQKKLKIPACPGVYFFLGDRKEILYIGRATSLRNRIKSYFSGDLQSKRSPLIEQMVKTAKTVEWTVTDSTLEALLLEANLIRTHKPRFNTIAKDDKSFNHLIITNEAWPRVLAVRAKDLTEKYAEADLKYVFGPFTSASLLKEALKIIQKLFQFYDTGVPIGKERSKFSKAKVNFNKDIGLYPNSDNKKEYQNTIRHLKLFFTGRKKQVIKELKKEMAECAKAERFEAATAIKKRISALEHIQDVALIQDDKKHYRDDKRVRIEAYDVAHLGGSNMVGVMTVIESGESKRSDYRRFKINSVKKPNDTAALKEILTRRFKHTEWPTPQIIVVDGAMAQKNAAELVLYEAGLSIPVIAVVKDDRHKPTRIIASKQLLDSHKTEIIFANAEAHRFSLAYHRQKNRRLNIPN